MWELDCKESWSLKNLCFWTAVLEKTLESLLDCKEIQRSILKEISPEYSLEGLMLKLKLRYFGHLCKELGHWKRPWCWERLKAEEQGDDRGWDGWWHHRLNGCEFEQALGVGDEAWRPAVHGIAKSGTQLSDWTGNYTFSPLNVFFFKSLPFRVFTKLWKW